MIFSNSSLLLVLLFYRLGGDRKKAEHDPFARQRSRRMRTELEGKCASELAQTNIGTRAHKTQMRRDLGAHIQVSLVRVDRLSQRPGLTSA